MFSQQSRRCERYEAKAKYIIHMHAVKDSITLIVFLLNKKIILHHGKYIHLTLFIIII